jgi:hypothetical protein
VKLSSGIKAGEDDNDSSTSSGSRHGRSRYRGRFFKCGERGHRAKDYRGKKERALLANVDDEPTLL